MKTEYADMKQYACYNSRFFAASLSTTAPKIGHLGIESGGRTRRHMDFNLLKPGLGAVPSLWKGLSDKFFSSKADSDGIKYVCGGKQPGSLSFQCKDEKNLKFTLTTEKPFSGDFFEFSFGNDVAPATVWAEPADFAILSTSGLNNKPDSDGKIINNYRLPLVLHFPDYGLLKIECDNKNVVCVEELVQLKEMTGLCLGFKNNGYHNRMFGYHHGAVRLKFHAKSKIKKVSLTLTVEKENYPQIKGCDFRSPKWDGLKRCWMNSFTLEKKSLTMGDNIALGGIAHLAVHFKSDLLLHTPELSNGIKVQDFLRRALMISFEKCQSSSGEINWEYQDNPDKKQQMSSFIDSTPSALIALYNSYQWDKDANFANKHIAGAVKAARFLINLDVDGDGIIEVPFHGNYFDDVHGRNRNWWDNFAFGHKDIYFNLLCHQALRSTLKLLEELGTENLQNEEPITKSRTRQARPSIFIPRRFALGMEGHACHDRFLNYAITSEIKEFLSKFDSNFDKTFFNPKTGVFAGWISRDGKVHDYMFTFASAMAINEGLVPKKKAVKVLKILLDKLDEMGFGDFKYGIPGPCIPVAAKDTINWDFMGKWPRYENGGLCGQNAYHFIQALYNCGLRKEADKILFTMLDTFENEPTHSGLMPGYMKSLDWRMKDGNPCGYNYLADNYYFLMAAVTGHFKYVGF
ncbi:MAG TPA: hypothetical protein DET40_01480 [Lentisphaeria bacterium]|nr:MAG: hypothetical protein A2X45_13185 [Lentisphaerae bacterium GWF2_50_93]HCE42204.1 hypothetical protein [Lentisphaeria bacterium]